VFHRLVLWQAPHILLHMAARDPKVYEHAHAARADGSPAGRVTLPRLLALLDRVLQPHRNETQPLAGIDLLLAMHRPVDLVGAA
jgi:hypothetical protein